MYSEAVRDLSTLIRKYPEDSLVEDGLFQKAMGEMRLRRDQEAMASFRELIERFPGSEFVGDAHHWQGMLLKEARRMEDAEEAFRHALKCIRRSELLRETEFNLALVLQKTGKLAEAATLLQSLLSSPLRDKFSASLLEWLSEYEFEREAFSGSIAAARLLVEGSGEAAWQEIGWGLIGRGYLAESDAGNAEEAFKKSLAANGGTHFAAESALRLGEIASAAKDHDDSVKYFAMAARLASNDSLLGVRARAYAGLAKTAKARSDLESAARYFMSVAILYEDPQLVPECLYEAADAFRQLGNDEACKKASEELVERYPDSEWAKKSLRAFGT